MRKNVFDEYRIRKKSGRRNKKVLISMRQKKREVQENKIEIAKKK